MKIHFFTRDLGHQRSAARLLAKGLANHGHKLRIVESRYPVECDLVVMWGHHNDRLIRECKSKGVDYLVMERGYVGDRRYWTAMGFNGLNGRADFCNRDVSGDRWTRLFADRLRPWRSGGDYVLLIGQVPGDASLAGKKMAPWYQEVTDLFRETGRTVRFRKHPMDHSPYCPTGADYSADDLIEDLAGASLVVTWNSNVGVDAALFGTPVIALDQGSMAWDVSGHELTADPVTPDRQRWAERLAWCQWAPHEIEDGTAWNHLRQKIGA